METLAEKRARAPGAKGRTEIIDIERDAGGKFKSKNPKKPQKPKSKPAVNAPVLDSILARRTSLLDLGEKWQPTKDEWDQLAAQVLSLHNVGHSLTDIASLLSLPDYTVRRALAHAAANRLTPTDRETARYWAASLLEHIIDTALAVGDLAEARKATINYLEALGLINQKGVQVGVQVNNNHVPESQVETEIKSWIQSQQNSSP